jgi:hypothetical protein
VTKAFAVFELLVGLAYGFAMFVFLTSMFAITTLIWDVRSLFYWGSMLAPLLLIVGGVLVLVGATPRWSSIVTMIGAATLTCWALYLGYDTLDGTVREGIDTGMIIIGAITFFVALAADFAAYKIGRAAGVLR